MKKLFFLLFPFSFLLLDFLFQGCLPFCCAASDLYVGVCVLVLFPLSREKERKIVPALLALAAISAACTLADFFFDRGCCRFTVFLQPLLLFFAVICEAYLRFAAEARALTIPVPGNMHWYAVESQARLFHCCASLPALPFMFASYFAAGTFSTVLAGVSALLQAGMCALLLKKKNSPKRVFLMGKEDEKKLYRCLQSNLAPFEGDTLPDEKKDWFYNSIVNYMEGEQPYLNPNLTKKDVSQALFSNTSYISRAINSNAGVEFRRFVNAYRIRYAVGAFKGNPRLRIDELTVMSGFNYVSTFASAFYDVMGQKPGEWMKNYRATLLRK